MLILRPSAAAASFAATAPAAARAPLRAGRASLLPFILASQHSASLSAETAYTAAK